MEQLTEHELHAPVEYRIELIDIAFGFERDPRQVDRGKAEVASAAGNLTARIIDVRDNSRAAAHVGDLGVEIAGLVIREVKGRVDEGEVREEALGGGLHRELEEVVVGILFVVADAFLDLEDLHREDRGLAVAEAGVGREEQVFHNHARFRRGVGAVVDGAERDLRAGAGVHRVEVVDERFHRLVGRAVGVPHRGLDGLAVRLLGVLALEALPDDVFDDLRAVFVGVAHADVVAERGFQLIYEFVGVGEVVAVGIEVELLKRLEILFFEGLSDAGRHAVVEVRHALAAVHLVLVRLDRYAGERGVAGDAVGLAQVAVAGGETALEELQQVDLAAGLGQHVEILVVNVDVAVDVRRGDVLRQDVVIDEIFAALGAVFQHRAHRGIGVDIRVLALDIGVRGGREGQFLIYIHQVGLGLTDLRVLGAVKNVRLRYLGVAVLDKLLFDEVLHLLNGGYPRRRNREDDLFGKVIELNVAESVGIGGVRRLLYRFSYLQRVERDDVAASLSDFPDHCRHPFFYNIVYKAMESLFRERRAGRLLPSRNRCAYYTITFFRLCQVLFSKNPQYLVFCLCIFN